jgi:pyruvate formate lyase activating enzyme
VVRYIIAIQVMNPEIYQAYTGKDNSIVLDNLEWLLKQGDSNRIMVRVPHIPEFNTDEDVMRSMEQLKKMGVKHIDEFNYLIR